MSALQRYNALDTIATFQLHELFASQLAARPEAEAVYREEKALSAPLMYAMLKGILVDQEVTQELKTKFDAESAELFASMDFITRSLGLGVINFSSWQHIKWFFSCLGEDLDSTDREALTNLAKSEPDLAPLCNIILMWRDRKKMLDLLQPELVDADGRMRTFYKVAGTDTQRLASSKNALWTGTNLMNLKREEDEDEVGHANIRSCFVADPGYKFVNIDLERADSWGVGLEVFQATGDRSYLDACGARDLHVHCARLIWPNLAWVGDSAEGDLAVAEQEFFRLFSYRQTSKHFQHACNYMSTAFGAARNLKIPLALCERGFRSYHKAFPGIRRWHTLKAKELQTTGSLTNLFGRVRNVHSRLDSDSTLRALIAFLGQSVTAYVMNRVILKLWSLQLSRPDLDFHFLAQVHDSGLYLINEANADETITLIREASAVPITVTSPQGETLTRSIPIEVATGWNWAKVNKKNPKANPDGLKKLKPGASDERTRQRYPSTPKVGQLGKRVSSL